MSAAAAGKPAKPARRGIGIFGLILLTAAAALSLPTAMVAGAGMIPTLVAWVHDGRRGSGAVLTVAPLNLCGVMMVLVRLWSGGSTTAHAIELMTNPVNLMVMMASGAFGWLLLYTLPPVFGGMIRARLERRGGAIKTEQDKLVDQWGKDITG